MRTEDGHIIRRCLNGEPEAFGFLVDKYKGAIYAFAYTKLRNFHDAEDVTQEVFINAYRKLRSLRRWDNFHAWIYAITSNLCRNWVRTRANRPDGEYTEDQDPETLDKRSESSYREGLMHESLYESLNEALDALPEGYRQVLTLYYLGGMSGDEIARFLGTSPSNVRQRLSRARSRLKEEMIAMMSTTLEAKGLPATFTFRVVEAVKRIRIHPVPRATALPWGLSLAAGIMVTVLSLSPHLSIPIDVAIPAGSLLPADTKALKTGEISVDILKTAEISVISSSSGDGGEPQLDNLQSAFLMAPAAEEGTWAGKSDMPTPRHGISGSVVNGKVYTIGGATSGGVPVGVFVGTVEEYDPATDTWTMKTDMPTKRNWHSASVVDGKVYVLGGESADARIVSTVEEYDPVADKWTRKANMRTPRGAHCTGVINGVIYVIGGTQDNEVGLSTVEAYDPATDQWANKADMPTARWYFSTSVVNGRIYAFGGAGVPLPWEDGQPLAVVEEYTPEAWPFSVLPPGKLPTKWGEVKSD